MTLNQTKILVTGGAGNVGSALIERLIHNTNHFVVIMDNLSTGFLSKLPSEKHTNWKFIKGDVNYLNDVSSVMLSYNFDYVFHFAAVVGVIRTQENPIDVLNDIEGIKNVLNLSKNTSVKHVYFSSSSEVYGEPVELPQNEYRTPLNSRVPYAVVKNVGECFFRSYWQSFHLPYTIFRFFNTYGPNQSTDFVVARFLASALKNKDITIYGDGMQTRTFTYVDDTVNVCAKIFEEKLLINDVINIGNDQLMTIKELAELTIRITNSKSKIIFLPPLKEGDMTRRQPDNTKMREILNKKLISIEEGIKLMMADERFLKAIASK
ncbi:MAG: NAD-dependent epimerase/dehydratase family protein [Bacteroidetes bacterium]|nr:NAD-dependent epimerase/dehydratase family protein [Bacteroidota bacterium]